MALTDSTVQHLLGEARKCKLEVPIVTDRLELRPFHESDAAGMVELLTDSEATKFIGGVKSPQAAADSVRTMRDAFVTRGWGTLALLLRSQDGCLGYCGVRPLPHTSEVEIAFALRRQYWNQGYCTEAAAASLDAAFNGLRVGSIVATVYPENKSSLRVLQKLGMQFESAVFGHWPMTTALLFRLQCETWLNRRQV